MKYKRIISLAETCSLSLSLSLSLFLSPGLWCRGFTPYTARRCATGAGDVELSVHTPPRQGSRKKDESRGRGQVCAKQP